MWSGKVSVASEKFSCALTRMIISKTTHPEHSHSQILEMPLILTPRLNAFGIAIATSLLLLYEKVFILVILQHFLESNVSGLFDHT